MIPYGFDLDARDRLVGAGATRETRAELGARRRVRHRLGRPADRDQAARSISSACSRCVPGAVLVLAGDGELRQTVEALARSSASPTACAFSATSTTSARGTPRSTRSSSRRRTRARRSSRSRRSLPACRSSPRTRAARATVVDDGETGLLAPVGDVAALAAQLERLRDDAALRRTAGRARARGGCASASRRRAWSTTSSACTGGSSAREGPPPTKVQGIGGAEQHLLALLAGAARARDRRALPLARRRRRRRAVPPRARRARRARGRAFRAGSTSRRDSPARSSRRCATSAPTSCTRTWCTRTSTARSRRTLCGTPFVSTRHNDDRYLLGPFRYVDRAFMQRRRRDHRDLGRGARVPHPRRPAGGEAGDDPLRARRAPAAPSELTPAERGIPPDAPARARDRPPDRAEGSRDAARRVRARARASTPTRGSRSSAGAGWRQQTQARVRGARARRRGAPARPRRAVGDWLARADVFAHTSRWEGFGIVLLEAMLAGLPVVATRVSAIPEIVVDGDHRRCSRHAGDAGGDRSRRCRRCSPIRRGARALGDAGRRRAREEFSVARMAERTIAVYEGVVRVREVNLRKLAFGSRRARPRRAALDLVPRPQQPALRRAAAAARAARRVPAAPAGRAHSRAASASGRSSRRSRCSIARVFATRGAPLPQPPDARLRAARRTGRTRR